MRRALILSLSIVFGLLASLLAMGNVLSYSGWDAAGQLQQQDPGAAVPCASPMAESDAHRAVWALPEVQQRAEALRQRGVTAVTLTVSAPDPLAQPPRGSAYTISLGEDYPDHVVPVESYIVDVCTGLVSRYDLISGQFTPIEGGGQCAR